MRLGSRFAAHRFACERFLEGDDETASLSRSGRGNRLDAYPDRQALVVDPDQGFFGNDFAVFRHRLLERYRQLGTDLRMGGIQDGVIGLAFRDAEVFSGIAVGVDDLLVVVDDHRRRQGFQ